MTLHEGTPLAAGMSAKRIDHVWQLARGWVEQGITPALVVIAARRGIVVLHDAFGVLTPEAESPPLALDTLFPMQSISKVVTATCAMTLVDDGVLGLNRPVQTYFPEFVGEGKEAVLVRHLMTHTTGLPGEEELEDYQASKKGSMDLPPLEPGQHPFLQERLLLCADWPLQNQPGTEMRYNGYGFAVLAEIVRRLSGQSLDDFARERIFEPLGMNNTYYIVPDAVSPRVVRRPDHAPDADLLNSALLRELPSASAGLYSAAEDMAKFCQMFLNRGRYGNAQILSPAAVAEMTRNQIPGIPARFFGESFPDASWGLGWSIHGAKTGVGGSLFSPQAFEHGGSGGVYMWADPVYEIVGIIFSVQLGPDSMTLTETLPYVRHDLFSDAVTAAVVDL